MDFMVDTIYEVYFCLTDTPYYQKIIPQNYFNYDIFKLTSDFILSTFIKNKYILTLGNNMLELFKDGFSFLKILYPTKQRVKEVKELFKKIEKLDDSFHGEIKGSIISGQIFIRQQEIAYTIDTVFLLIKVV